MKNYQISGTSYFEIFSSTVMIDIFSSRAVAIKRRSKGSRMVRLAFSDNAWRKYSMKKEKKQQL